ncbi:unnamed protein product [Soboliphyme baturini]|uniref:1-acyl-sn-glycerol-3-phosphate acyltransferase n=1 Tax=Soboliphyme baturini TaxID=241478 RepID=A0A183IH90_9BILA|nr:unnamed protein product [Soboliphyme baturini]
MVMTIVIVLYCLFAISPKVQYFVKMAVYIFDVLLTTFLVQFVAFPWPGDVDNFKFVKLIFMKLVSWIDIRWELRGKENLNVEGPAVLVCNHQSSLDLMGMMVAWPPRCVPLVKKELMYAGPFGIAGKLCGCIFIDRFNKNSAIQKMNAMVEAVVQNNIKIWIFPEGTRNHGKSMLPFKKGAFYLAVEAKASIPIIPVIFSSYDYFYSKKEHKFSPGFVLIDVLPAISTENLTNDDVDLLSQKTRAQMLAVFERNSLEAREKFFSSCNDKSPKKE